MSDRSPAEGKKPFQEDFAAPDGNDRAVDLAIYRKGLRRFRDRSQFRAAAT